MSTCRQQIADRVNNGVAWKTLSCICSCQLCIKSEVCCGTVGRCGDGWKLRRITGKARNMMENALSILIVIFSVQLQQTEIWERKLFIFHLWVLIRTHTPAPNFWNTMIISTDEAILMIKIQNENMNVVKLMVNFYLMMRIIECQSHYILYI